MDIDQILMLQANRCLKNLFVVYLPEDYELEEIKSNVNIFRSIIRNVDKNMQLLNDEFFCHVMGDHKNSQKTKSIDRVLGSLNSFLNEKTKCNN